MTRIFLFHLSAVNIMSMKYFSSLSLPEKLTELYLAALFLVLPLYYHNAYFDITEAKLGCFMLLTILYVLLMPFVELKDGEEKGVSPAALSFLVYAAVSILSSLLFIGRAALLAPENRYQGAVVLGLYGLSFLFCSRHGRFGPLARICALTGLGLVSLLAVLQSFGADVLGLWEGVRAGDRGRYLSTIGNVNFLGAYFSLLLPLCAGLYCKGETKAALALPCLALGSCALLCGSDSGILGALSALPLLFGLCAGEETARRAFGTVLTVMGLSFFLYGLLLSRWGLLGLSTAGALLSAPWAALPVAAAGLGLRLWGRTVKRPWLLPGLLSLSFALAVLGANLMPGLIPGAVRDYLVFSPAWGSDRGSIWLHALELFRSHSPLQKLIGGGSGCLARFDRLRRLFPDAVVDCAHNEYLQILLTGGVLGLAAYAAALLSALKQGMKKRPALAAAVFGCAVQAGVNIAQCATTPLLLMLTAVLA